MTTKPTTFALTPLCIEVIASLSRKLKGRSAMLLQHWRKALATTLFALACSQLGLAQGPPPTILRIETENSVNYIEDVSDVSKFATTPAVTTAVPPPNFGFILRIADIVAVNGRPARGTVVFHLRRLGLATAPSPGQAIADTVRGSIQNITYEILGADGTPIGTILAVGLEGGSPPPGAPLAQIGAQGAIVGGTGAFLGARGEGGNSSRGASRSASISEDPANRRTLGGGRVQYVLHLIPMTRPEITFTGKKPDLFHADSSRVTPANPARTGEILTLMATGLGPTRPGVDLGQPFTDNPQQEVNSPVEVLVNGKPAEVISKVGLAGTTDTFRIEFRVPEGAAGGEATIQLSAAFVLGSEVKIAIQ